MIFLLQGDSTSREDAVTLGVGLCNAGFMHHGQSLCQSLCFTLYAQFYSVVFYSYGFLLPSECVCQRCSLLVWETQKSKMNRDECALDVNSCCNNIWGLWWNRNSHNIEKNNIFWWDTHAHRHKRPVRVIEVFCSHVGSQLPKQSTTIFCLEFTDRTASLYRVQENTHTHSHCHISSWEGKNSTLAHTRPSIKSSAFVLRLRFAQTSIPQDIMSCFDGNWRVMQSAHFTLSNHFVISIYDQHCVFCFTCF